MNGIGAVIKESYLAFPFSSVEIRRFQVKTRESEVQRYP